VIFSGGISTLLLLLRSRRLLLLLWGKCVWRWLLPLRQLLL
jgi:hypothetical protein